MSESICEQYRAEDGAVVLIVKHTPIEHTFYKPAAEAFLHTARTELYAAALEDYALSDDRRKRYRFPAHTADFCLAECSDHTELRILRNGRLLRHEKHFWDGEILKKRERLK